MAAPFQNYSGGVLLADIVKRNNLSRYVQEAIKERSQFVKSGAVVRNSCFLQQHHFLQIDYAL